MTLTLNNPKKLAPLQTSWHNKSLSSVNSDAATFHTAHANNPPIELELEQSTSKQISPPCNISVLKVKMSRQDSGFDAYAESTTSKDDRRSSSSTSSSRRRHSSKQPGLSKRSSRSSAQTHRPSAPRHPSFQSRRMASFCPSTASKASISQQQQQYQFFQFASLITPPSDPSSPTNPSSSILFPLSAAEPEPEPMPEPVLPPPPATVNYWTSDSTRRLEYAAIDAASRGLRGFITKLIPDCFLPENKRRPRFHEEGDDEDSDAGSVRRYRLALPEEKGLGHEQCALQNMTKKEKLNGPKKWSGFGLKRS
ncbi:hypothetical protein B7463_g28, partial [Scytalidium lignicola]